MGQEAGDYHDQQDLFDVVGILCPECGEYWEAIGTGWVQCPTCDYEFEANDGAIFSTTGDNDFVPPDPDPFESQEFAPLIETAGPLIYRNNGFRITGLSVNASERDVARHLKELGQLAKFGLAAGPKHVPLPLSPDENAVQSAIARLKDSERRLVDEFFWFWPPEWNLPIEEDLLVALAKGDIDSAADLLIRRENRDQPKKVATHNLAVLFHAAALDLEIESASRRLSDEELKKRDVYWLQAFRYWKSLIDDEGFWKHFSSRIEQLEDPRFTAGNVRGSLPMALTLIVAKLALGAAEKGAFTEANLYLHLILGFGIDRQIISEAMVRVARPLRERIKALCDDAKKDADRDPAHADRVFGDLLTRSMPLIDIMRCLLNENTSTSIQLIEDACDEVASFINNELASFAEETNEWGVCAHYLEKALSIAVSPFLKEKIVESLDIVRHNAEIARQGAERQRIESYLNNLLEEIEGIIKSSLSPEAMFRRMREIAPQRLDPIKKEWGKTSEAFNTASNLLAGVLRSIAINLHNDSQQYQLALEAISLAFRLCRDFELRQQLRDDYSRINERAEYDKLTKDLKPVSSPPPLFSINGIGTTIYGRSDFDKNTNSYLTTLYFIFLAIPIFPIARYRVIASEGNSFRFLGKAALRQGDIVHRLVFLLVVGWLSISIFSATDQSRLTGVTPTPTATVSYQYSISELIDYLNAPDAKTRLWAAQRLAERGSEARQAIPALRSKLKDKDREVRAAAQAALAKISLSSGTDEYSQQPAAGNDAGQPASSSFQFTTPSDDQVFTNQSSYETDQLRKEIESAKEQLRLLEAEMDPIEDQLDNLKVQIDDYAATLRRYKRESDLGNEVDIDSYNNTRTRHNSLVEEHNQLLAEHRSIVARHKALVGETNEKVNRYNNLIRGQR